MATDVAFGAAGATAVARAHAPYLSRPRGRVDVPGSFVSVYWSRPMRGLWHVGSNSCEGCVALRRGLCGQHLLESVGQGGSLGRLPSEARSDHMPCRQMAQGHQGLVDSIRLDPPIGHLQHEYCGTVA